MSAKYSHVFLASAALAGLIMASGLQAQAQGKPLGLYSRMDSNGDGKVSLAEFEAAHATQLARFDANKNGTVTVSEVDAFFAPHLSQGGQFVQQRLATLRSADANGDGVISAEEFKTAGEAEFKAADANGDGYIEVAEVQATVP